ncbi:MAG: hypothetical protein JO112_00275, partial [Planctomycetes bacterium]|nr:hypothetical protein [Planctomycetota bacterium]
MRTPVGVVLFLLLGAGGCAGRVDKDPPDHGLPLPVALVEAPSNPPQEKGTPGKETPGPAAGERSVYPQDRGGELLSRELAPSEKLPPLPGDEGCPPRHWPERHLLQHPEPPLPSVRTEPVRLSIQSTPRTPRPSSPPDNPSLVDGIALYPALPEPPPLWAGPRLHVPSPDVGQLPLVPLLSPGPNNRVPLTDPTTEASRTAALAAPLPVRTNPAPFQAVNL